MSESVPASNEPLQEKTIPTQQPQESQITEESTPAESHSDATSNNGSEGNGPGLKCYLVSRS